MSHNSSLEGAMKLKFVLFCSSRDTFHVATGMVVETGRSPVVGLIFLNELGDQQVVPYKRSRTLSVGRDSMCIQSCIMI